MLQGRAHLFLMQCDNTAFIPHMMHCTVSYLLLKLDSSWKQFQTLFWMEQNSNTTEQAEADK